jgi:YD repeat-containing protein
MPTQKIKEEKPYPSNLTAQWASGGVDFYENSETTVGISADATLSENITPVDGQVLTFNAVTKKWEARNMTTKQAVQIDYAGTPNIVYQGAAAAGTLTSDSAWQISKNTYDENGNLLSITWAGGTTEYLSSWDDRASLTYS